MKKVLIIISLVLIFVLTGCSQKVDDNFMNSLNYPNQNIRWGVKDVPQSYPKAPDEAQKISDFYTYNTIKEIVLNNEYLSKHFVLGERLGEGYHTSLDGDPVFLEMTRYGIVGVTKEHYNDYEYMANPSSYGPEPDFEIMVSSAVDYKGNQYFDIDLEMINLNDQEMQTEMYDLWEKIVGPEIAKTLVFGEYKSKEDDLMLPLSYESTETNSKLLALSNGYKYQYILKRVVSEDVVILNCSLVHVNPSQIGLDYLNENFYSYDRLIDNKVQEIMRTKSEDIYKDIKISNINPEIPEDFFKELFESIENKVYGARQYTTHFETITIGEYQYDYRASIMPNTMFAVIYKGDEVIYRKVRARGYGFGNDPYETLEQIKYCLNLFVNLESIDGIDIESAMYDWVNDKRALDDVEDDKSIGIYEQTVIRNGVTEKLELAFRPYCIYKDGDIYMDIFGNELSEVELTLDFIYTKEVE